MTNENHNGFRSLKNRFKISIAKSKAEFQQKPKNENLNITANSIRLEERNQKMTQEEI